MIRLRLWPDAAEQALLHAALDTDRRACDAFADWQRHIDWDDDIEGGSLRLLPLVHANLSNLACPDPQRGRLAGIYRYHWCAAQTHIRSGGHAIHLLKAADIPVMVTKGLALACSVYPSPALRPMSDIDLLVPLSDALRALDILTKAGWAEPAATRRQWQHRRRDMLILTSGINLHHPQNGEIDLHWTLMHESGGTGLDDALWASAEPIIIAGETLLRPSPSFMLLHIIAHGLRPNALSPLRWVADAAMLLRHEATRIDWPMIRHWAKRLHVAHRITQGLCYLQTVLALPLPAAAAPPGTSWLERIEDRSWEQRLARPAEAPLSGFDRSAQLARLVATRHRRHLPRLAAAWLQRRLRASR